jgi:hypothetical protein
VGGWRAVARRSGKPCIGKGFCDESDRAVQWIFPPLDFTLYTDEADNYLLNVTAAEPRIFVMWRQDDEADPPVRPMQLSASYGEAARWMDSGERVDGLPMPPKSATGSRPSPAASRRHPSRAGRSASRAAATATRTTEGAAMADDPVRGFLGRWSRLKHAGRGGGGREAPVEPVTRCCAVSARRPQPKRPSRRRSNRSISNPTTAASSADRVDAGLKRAALKKLFHTEHFNTMDGLDVYIEDFSVFEPLPQSMVAQLGALARNAVADAAGRLVLPAVPAQTRADAASAADAAPPGLPDESPSHLRHRLYAPPAAASDAVPQAAPENGEFRRRGKSRFGRNDSILSPSHWHKACKSFAGGARDNEKRRQGDPPVQLQRHSPD